MFANSLRAQARAVVASSRTARIGLLHRSLFLPCRYSRLLSTSHVVRTPSAATANPFETLVDEGSEKAAQDQTSAALSSSPDGKLFIGNLPAWVAADDLKNLFEKFGDIQVFLNVPEPGRNAGYAHIQFPTEEVAADVIKKHGQEPFEIDGRQLHVNRALSNSADTLYVGNVPYDASLDDIQDLFSKYDVQILRIDMGRRRDDGKPLGFVHVHFASEADATKILEQHAISPFGLSDRTLFVEYPRKRQGRPQDRPRTLSPTKLHLRNLPGSVTEAELRDLFTQKGEIMEVRVEHYKDSEEGRAFAFVDFVQQDVVREILEEHQSKPYEYSGEALQLQYGYNKRTPLEAPPYHTLYIYAVQSDDENALRECFGEFGTRIRRVSFWKKPGKADSGYPAAFVELNSVKDAIEAKAALDGKEVSPGFQLKVQYAQERAQDRYETRAQDRYETRAPSKGTYGMKNKPRQQREMEDADGGDSRTTFTGRRTARGGDPGTRFSGRRMDYGADWGGSKPTRGFDN